MKIGIMQPYFLPYIGYFQLISAVDRFIIYDNIKYTKRGWINRNRILKHGSSAIFSLPLKKASDSLNVLDRELAVAFDRKKLLNQFKSAYYRAQEYDSIYPLIEKIINYEDLNLSQYINHSIIKLCEYMKIDTEIIISSSISIAKDLKGQAKVIELCKACGADVYINPIGGTELYARDDFHAQGLDLRFIKTKSIEYTQFGNAFVPALSIIDTLMFSPINTVRKYIDEGYEFLT